jgi:predicted lipid-binding transport protein (Tim44 family)
VPVGPHVPHVPVHVIPTGGGARAGGQPGNGDEVVSWVLGILLCVLVVAVAVGVVLFLRKRFRRPPTVASAADLPPDWIHPPEEVAGRAHETENLLQTLTAQDPRVAPSAMRDLVWSVFVQAQQHWEARNYTPMRDLLTPELYDEHTAAVDSMRRLHVINQLVGLTIERLELVNVRWPVGDDGQEVTTLVTFQAVSQYLSDRGVAVSDNHAGPTRFQEFWVFRRQGGEWKLAAIEMTRESTRLEDANEVAPLVGTDGFALH